MGTVAIIGSGIVGTTFAYRLSQAGHTVHVFERGPEAPYPDTRDFEQRFVGYQPWEMGASNLPPDLNDVVQTGDYESPLRNENISRVGGKANHWGAVTPRMAPKEFALRTNFGYGVDWPLRYEDIEKDYCDAEAQLGVSGDDADNPFAPPRSKPYPISAFPLSYGMLRLRALFNQHGVVTSSTPYARTKDAYDGRPACQNYGVCDVCPIGVRYYPQHHLQRAIATGRCLLHTNSPVSRILFTAGRATGVLYHADNAINGTEMGGFDAVIVAAGPIETARLLLLSTSSQFPHGVGNQHGHVGQHYFMHHSEFPHADLKEPLYHGRDIIDLVANAFLESPKRGAIGGHQVSFISWNNLQLHVSPGLRGLLDGEEDMTEWTTGKNVLAQMRLGTHCQTMVLDHEVLPDKDKYIELATKRDRFGDPVAAVHYKLSEFDRVTMRDGAELVNRLMTMIGGTMVPSEPWLYSGHHHFGGARMSERPADGVVDSWGAVHGVANLFVAGGATFPTFSPVNPTLTMVALAIRTSERLVRELK